jgi:sucrose-6F-phosphate phosphohydrolase
MEKLLLATDLDGTLTGDDQALIKLNKILSELRGQMKLIYVTGRSLESYVELKSEELPLIEPDALVTAVGTEIYLSGGEQAKWPIAPKWDRSAITHRLKPLKSLKLQQDSEQRPFKVSYFYDGEDTSHIRELLVGISVDVLYSHGKYLDVLPKGVNKGSAIKFLAKHWQIEPTQVIACGDSANDISMLQGNRAIVVGNSQQELKDWAYSHKDQKVYISKKASAGGVLEGLEHFGIPVL